MCMSPPLSQRTAGVERGHPVAADERSRAVKR
jgi:hypothetical protein